MSQAQTRRIVPLASAALVAIFLALPALAQQRTNVAVFNFQMKSQTPDWAWMEKGLADQITTHLAMAGTLNVIARDEMQAVSQKVRWTPELGITDPQGMSAIREQLKIEYLVTGLYAVEGEQVKITAQIIQMETRKELARKELAGPLQEVLELERKVSAEVQGWFSKKPAAEILPQLPVWTRSLPATKALYEGMDLYDQGRYGEAWLRFRQAAKDDGDYLEAQYWVGKMFYFMDRYEHARVAFDRFVYMDRAHPRMGDAILEYLHTYEMLETPPEVLLALYADFQRRFPEVVMTSREDSGLLTASAWLRVRSAQLLHQLGRVAEAARLCSDVLEEHARRWPLRLWTKGVWTGWSWQVGYASAQAFNQLTGEVLMPPGLADRMHNFNQPSILRFAPGQTELTVTHSYKKGVARSTSSDGKVRYGYLTAMYILLAPDGYALKKLTVYPFLEGQDGNIDCGFDQYANNDVPGEKLPVAEAGKKGLVIDDIPRAGVLQFYLSAQGSSPSRDPGIYYTGLRAVAQWEKIGPHGSILLSCTNSSNFFARLDGRRACKGGGLVGLVPPGRHNLQFRYGDWGSVYAPQDVEVDVEANQTTEITVQLPFDPNGPLAGWTSSALIGRDYPPGHPCLQHVDDSPSVVADEKAIRVFWTHEGDLWQAVSTDGNSFSRPARLPMPVSTGWIEQSPLCLREESGRFLLAFLSDRDEQHLMRPYVCWSRDAANWSRPSAIGERSVNKFDMIQDSRGRFLWADATDKKVTILTSRDAYRWEPAASWKLPGEERAIRLLQRSDGSYELFAVDHEPRGVGPGDNEGRIAYCYSSKDGAQWSPPERIRDFQWDYEMAVSAMDVAGRTLVAFMESPAAPFVAWAQRDGKGNWEKSRGLDGIGSHCGVATYHPRWGFLICWRHPGYMGLSAGGYGREERGPFLIRGDSVEKLFQPPAPVAAGAASSVGGKPK
jgi:TolB-like protein